MYIIMTTNDNQRYKNDNLGFTINIKSKDRLRGDPEDFVVSTQGFSNKVIKTMELESVEIPNTMYVFNSTNNVITFSEGGGDLTATITPGTYSISNLETEIKTRMDTAGSDTYTVSIDETTKKLTVSSNGIFSLLFSEPNNPYKELGFTEEDTAIAASHTSTNVVKLSGFDFLYLYIRNYAQMGIDTGENSFSFKIPINKSFGDIVFYTKNAGLNQTFFNPNTFQLQSQMIIKLFNPDGEIVELNGSEWSFTLRMTFYDNNLQIPFH